MASPVRVALVVLAASIALTGCAAESPALPDSTSTAPAAEPSAPFTIACDTLITPAVLYDYSASFASDPGFTPAAGSTAASIVADGGIACGWVNLTSGETITIAVLAVQNDSQPTYGTESHFELTGEVGRADAFSDPYWIVAESTWFYEPGDADPLITAAIAALG